MSGFTITIPKEATQPLGTWSAHIISTDQLKPGDIFGLDLGLQGNIHAQKLRKIFPEIYNSGKVIWGLRTNKGCEYFKSEKLAKGYIALIGLNRPNPGIQNSTALQPYKNTVRGIQGNKPNIVILDELEKS